MNHNKGATWRANLRKLNPKGWNENLVLKVECMSNEQWDAEAIALGRALETLRVDAPHTALKAQQLNDRFCEEGNPVAAVILARGVVALAALNRGWRRAAKRL